LTDIPNAPPPPPPPVFGVPVVAEVVGAIPSAPYPPPCNPQVHGCALSEFTSVLFATRVTESF